MAIHSTDSGRLHLLDWSLRQRQGRAVTDVYQPDILVWNGCLRLRSLLLRKPFLPVMGCSKLLQDYPAMLACHQENCVNCVGWAHRRDPVTPSQTWRLPLRLLSPKFQLVRSGAACFQRCCRTKDREKWGWIQLQVHSWQDDTFGSDHWRGHRFRRLFRLSLPVEKRRMSSLWSPPRRSVWNLCRLSS